MKTSRMLIFALLLSFMCGCQKKEITPEERVEAEQIIEKQQVLFSKAFAEKDLDALVSLYADNGALYYDNHPILRGKKAIRERWESDFARPDLIMSTLPGSNEISNTGDLAWAHGTFRINANLPRGFASDQWRYALIFKKLPEGWKIWADSANAELHNRLSDPPPKGRSPWAPLAPLIGLGCFFSMLWFLTGMPILTIVYGWKALRTRSWSTGLIVSLSMLLGFCLVVALFWIQLSGHYWNLSLRHAFIAAGDTERYGNPVEDTAESVLVSLIVIAVTSGLAAGILARAARWLWTRHLRIRDNFSPALSPKMR
jgi:ketosteroid isomerase-like protein